MPENSYQDYTEPALIAAIQKGSHQALDVLYDKYAPVFLGIISRIVCDEKIADDVLTESFVEIWSKVRGYDISKGHFFIWMINIVRAHAIATNQTCQSLVQHDSANQNNQEEKIVVIDMLTELQPAPKSQALELVLFKGYCYEQVAEELGVLSESIKSKVRLEFKELGTK